MLGQLLLFKKSPYFHRTSNYHQTCGQTQALLVLAPQATTKLYTYMCMSKMHHTACLSASLKHQLLTNCTKNKAQQKMQKTATITYELDVKHFNTNI